MFMILWYMSFWTFDWVKVIIVSHFFKICFQFGVDWSNCKYELLSKSKKKLLHNHSQIDWQSLSHSIFTFVIQYRNIWHWYFYFSNSAWLYLSLKQESSRSRSERFIFKKRLSLNKWKFWRLELLLGVFDQP